MPWIKFLHSDIGLQVPSGTELIEIYRRNPHSLPIKFGCTRGDCGVCAIKVVEGENNLSKCSKQERTILEGKKLGKDCRLACQCAINGDVVLDAKEEI